MQTEHLQGKNYIYFAAELRAYKKVNIAQQMVNKNGIWHDTK